MSDFSWPDVRKSIFKMKGSVGDSKTKCFIKHAGMFDFDFSYMSDQYKRAADKIILEVKNGSDIFHPDGLFFPTAYLYRHSIELKLKAIIDINIKCKLIENNESVQSAMSWHNVNDLWNILKPSLIEQWPDADRNPLNNVEALIREFYLIDKSGQAFRYSHSKEGNVYRDKFPDVVCLQEIKDCIDELNSFLSGCEAHFQNIFDYIQSEKMGGYDY